MIRKGRDNEKVVLGPAIRAHLEHRILVHGNRPVVFGRREAAHHALKPGPLPCSVSQQLRHRSAVENAVAVVDVFPGAPASVTDALSASVAAAAVARDFFASHWARMLAV
jgi:hypothetical protein